MDLRNRISSLAKVAAGMQQSLDKLHGSEPLLSLPVDGEISGLIDNVHWRAGIGSAAQLQVLSAAGDRDEDAIFGRRSATGSVDQRPLLEPVLGAAYVKVALRGQASVNGRRPGGAGRIELSEQAQVGLGAYLRSDAEARLEQVLAERGAEFPFVLAAEDVRALAVGDACFCQVGGTLAASLEVVWSDLMSGPIDALRGLVPGDAPAHFAFKAGATAAVAVSINDGFRAVFIGEDEQRVRVVLNRARSDAFQLRADVAIDGRLAQPDIDRSVLAQLVAQLFAPRGAPAPAWEAALLDWLDGCQRAVEDLRKTLGDAFDRFDRQLADAGVGRALAQLARLHTLVDEVGRADGDLAARLEVPVGKARAALETLDGLAEALRERLDDRLDDLLARLGQPSLRAAHVPALATLLARVDAIEAAVIAAANRKIHLGLRVEYRRLATDATLFEAMLRRDSADFGKCHRYVLRLDIARLLAADRADTVTLTQFMHQTTLIRRFALGLDLGAFYRQSVKTQRRWTDTVRRIPRTDRGDGLYTERRHAFLGYQSLDESNFLQQHLACRGDLDASFLAPGDEATPGRWHFALSLSAELGEARADPAALLRVADYASVWGVIGEDEATAFAQTLADTGALGQPIAAAVGLTLGNAAFHHRPFLDAWAEADDALFVDALAAALPRLEDFPARREIAARRAAYAAALPVLMLHGETGIDLRDAEGIARYVERHLPDDETLRRFERTQGDGSVAYMNARGGRDANFLAATRQLTASARSLRRCLADAYGRPDERAQVEEAFAGLSRAWQNRFLLRWQVWALRQLALGARVPRQSLQARLKFTVGRGSDATAHVFAAAAELR